MLDAAKTRTTVYLENKDSILAIDMRFEKLKREFFVPPTDEWQEREKILTSPKNIVFLYLEKKMELDGLTLESVVMKFGGEKGYLTYDEFRAMVSGLKIGLTPHQINSCIRDVDDDGDGLLDMQELRDVSDSYCIYLYIYIVYEVYIYILCIKYVQYCIHTPYYILYNIFSISISLSIYI